jgi:hypothetical protein
MPTNMAAFKVSPRTAQARTATMATEDELSTEARATVSYA